MTEPAQEDKQLPPGLSFWHPAALLATWFGTGLLGRFPGTLASLAALPCAWIVVREYGPLGLAIALAATLVTGLWASSVVIAESKKAGRENDDPQYIVIDEIAGQGLTLMVVPLEPYLYFAGFVLFRFFDILKPWPVNRAEQRLKGGLGIIADDIVAGAYAAIFLFLFYILKQWIEDVF